MALMLPITLRRNVLLPEKESVRAIAESIRETGTRSVKTVPMNAIDGMRSEMPACLNDANQETHQECALWSRTVEPCFERRIEPSPACVGETVRDLRKHSRQ